MSAETKTTISIKGSLSDGTPSWYYGSYTTILGEPPIKGRQAVHFTKRWKCIETADTIEMFFECFHTYYKRLGLKEEMRPVFAFMSWPEYTVITGPHFEDTISESEPFWVSEHDIDITVETVYTCEEIA